MIFLSDKLTFPGASLFVIVPVNYCARVCMDTRSVQRDPHEESDARATIPVLP